MSHGTLYVLATPIGNLGDITLRAIETLKTVDTILCEDTRVTSKLLHHLQIAKPLVSYHEHSDAKKTAEILQMLSEGKNIALVTDAGTPGISDPGNRLISDIGHQMSDVVITTIPGASAVTAALSISGFPTDKFLFLGFPPHKNKRKKFFETVAASEYTTIFYESSHRIRKALAELTLVLDPKREICICRELTKAFESVYRGTISEINAMTIPDKGEFVVIVR
jgi:16S rRNA (cytidine1402-2'-O)-methyltransferase